MITVNLSEFIEEEVGREDEGTGGEERRKVGKGKERKPTLGG